MDEAIGREKIELTELMEQTQEVVRPDEVKKLKPGEKGFAFFWLVIGLFFTWQSYLLYQKAPGASSYGTVPLFCSAVITILSAVIIMTDWRKSVDSSGNKLRELRSYLCPLDIVVMAVFIVAYCVALSLGAGFMIVTPIFLWGSMTFLSRGNYVKNILWTALCMAFIYVVFRILFSVVLP